MVRTLILAAPLALTACAAAPVDPPGTVQPIGNFVAIGQTASLGDGMTITPKAVPEDSRCPTGVQCVWGGRVVVTARVAGPGWRESVSLVSGEAQPVHGHRILLIEVLPAQRPQSGLAASDYRLRFTADY